ncbi:MAG TPA: response regulator [Ktedonobacterales bacterium]|jgi:CheY-like chemotaxis protein
MTQVLAVDDSETMRQSLRMMLEPAGYPVAEAGDGVEALAALRASHEPLVVLLDYYMPRLDGGGVLAQVSAEGGALARHEYIVISSSVGTFPDDFIDLSRRLSIRILPKPFEEDLIVTLVGQAAARLNALPPEPLPDLPDLPEA